MHLNLKYKPSTFFSNFSIVELVKKNNSRSGAICSAGGGGGVGTGSSDYSPQKDESHFVAHNSATYSINPANLNEFDEVELIQSLRADLEKEIIDTGASVINSDYLNPSGFYIEYSDEGILGRVEVTGAFNREESFNIKVTLNEKSKSQKKPVVKKKRNEYQPVGNYYVVAFEQDNEVARMFYKKMQKAVEDSRERLRQKYLANKAQGNVPEENMEQMVMYVWAPMPPQVRQYLQEMTGEEFEDFTEYDQYGRVYFLNELALRMYRDIGEDFEILKIITAEDVSKVPGGPAFRAYYIPKEE
jgi:hypothetical protein